MHDAVSQPADQRPDGAATPLTLTAYAARRGVSTKSVSRAVAAGRLVRSVGRTDRGQPTIVDPELADREWAANTRHRIDPDATSPRCDEVAVAAGTTAPSQGSPIATASRGVELPPGVPDYNTSRAVHARASARRYAAQAEIAEMQLAERRGELVRIADLRAAVMAKFTLLRTRMLAIPSLVAQQFPHLAAEIVPVIEKAIHDALEELANMDRVVTP